MGELSVFVEEKLSSTSQLGRQWERLVLANATSGFMQGLDWAEVKRRQGVPSFHVLVCDGEQLLGGGIFYTSAKRNGIGIVIAPEGPVLPWHDEEVSMRALRLIIEAVQDRAVSLGTMAMRIEPRLPPPPGRLLREFGRAPADLVPNETLYFDLSVPLDAMLSSMKDKARYNIRLAERRGVATYVDQSQHAVENFHEALRHAGKRNDFAVEPLRFFEELAAVLVPTGQAKFIFARHDEDVLGALLLITYGQRATYLYGGVSNEKRNLMAGYALQWAGMKMAKEAGCLTYDFYGFDQYRDPEHRYAKFSQFKSRFGGEPVHFIGGQDYFFLDNVADVFVKLVRETAGSAR